MKRLTIYDVNVDDATNEELLTLTSQISHKSRGKLEKLLAEAEKSGKDGILKKTWKQNVEERIAFKKDQTRNGIARSVHKRIIIFLLFNFSDRI